MAAGTMAGMATGDNRLITASVPGAQPRGVHNGFANEYDHCPGLFARRSSSTGKLACRHVHEFRADGIYPRL
jgi:hypothetical protein